MSETKIQYHVKLGNLWYLSHDVDGIKFVFVSDRESASVADTFETACHFARIVGGEVIELEYRVTEKRCALPVTL